MSTIANNPVPTPPIEYPLVTVGGVPYELRFTVASSFLLEQWNIPVGKFLEWQQEEFKAGRISNMILTTTAAMLGNEVNGEWEPLAITPLKLASRLREDEWVLIMQQRTTAMLKAASLLMPAPPAGTPETGPTLQ